MKVNKSVKRKYDVMQRPWGIYYAIRQKPDHLPTGEIKALYKLAANRFYRSIRIVMRMDGN